MCWLPSLPFSAVTLDTLNREEWESLELHCHSHPQPARLSQPLGKNSMEMLLLREQGWKEGKTGPERSLRAALLLWCSAAGVTHPLKSMKASLALCQSDSLFPPREEFWSSAMTRQPCCGSPHSCRETGLLMEPCI